MLSNDSIVNVSQVLTIDRSLLTEVVSKLPDRIMDTVDDGLRLVMNLVTSGTSSKKGKSRWRAPAKNL